MTKEKKPTTKERLEAVDDAPAVQEPTASSSTNDENDIRTERSVLGKLSLFFLELIKIALLAGLTIGLVRYFLFKPFSVKGNSMDPTYKENEYLIVDEITYRFRTPERGEVVVFESPTRDGDNFLKRIIGLPGERVKIEEDRVIIYSEQHPQGIVLDEPYLSEETPGATTVTLGPDQYFVLGDNRDASFDSRRFGPIHISSIVGRTVFRGWPFHRISTFEAPQYNF